MEAGREKGRVHNHEHDMDMELRRKAGNLD
jgi:hypothetical protein